ncbi:hypothetical protein GCM10028895_34160 [Pontibacter rugosus]
MKYKFLILTLLWTAAAMAQKQPLSVAELSINIPVSIEQALPTKQQDGVYYYGFQQGDKVLLSIETEKAGQPVNLEVREFASGSMIYKARDQKKLRTYS